MLLLDFGTAFFCKMNLQKVPVGKQWKEMFMFNEAHFQSELKELMSKNMPIILVGALYAGRLSYSVLKSLQISPSCFCDNDKEKQGKIFSR